MKRLIIILIIVIGFFINSFGQASATMIVVANVVQPISISKITDMSFGNIATSNIIGAVVLTPSGNRTITGGVALPSAVGVVTPASFDAVGSGTLTYSISLPISAILSYNNNTMTVNNFVSFPSNSGNLSASGSQKILVGATLNISQNQEPGMYATISPVPVTINYN